MSDLGITVIRKYVTEDGQEFIDRAQAVAHQVSISGNRALQLMKTALDTADLLEAGNITLAQFNNNRPQFVALLRKLGAIGRGEFS